MQKHQVSFTKERVPSSTEESLEHDARIEEAYKLPPPMWWAEDMPNKKADWLRPGEEVGIIPVEGDEDLENPSMLEPHL